MSCYQDALSNIMPVDWLDPYGRTPFANGAEMSVDITIVETEDGIRATSVKNPPKAGPSRLVDALKNALGIGFLDQQSPQEEKLDKEKKENKNLESSDFAENQQKEPVSGKENNPKLEFGKEDEDDRDR